MARKKQKSEALHTLIMIGVALIVILFGFNYYIYSQIKELPTLENTPMMGKPISSMPFSEFDKAKARAFMDKDNDGKCDVCGMQIEQCIASGMMQCSGMDPEATMGVLGSQHIHADWKIYLDGKEFDWSLYADRHERQMHGDKNITDTSAFIHIHPAEAPEKAGDVLHMHATGIPLSLFFESLGMHVDGNCLQSVDKKYCGLKIYLNGKEQVSIWDYVFNDFDKILITDGKGNIEEQLGSITSFAEAH